MEADRDSWGNIDGGYGVGPGTGNIDATNYGQGSGRPGNYGGMAGLEQDLNELARELGYKSYGFINKPKTKTKAKAGPQFKVSISEMLADEIPQEEVQKVLRDFYYENPKLHPVNQGWGSVPGKIGSALGFVGDKALSGSLGLLGTGMGLMQNITARENNQGLNPYQATSFSDHLGRAVNAERALESELVDDYTKQGYTDKEAKAKARQDIVDAGYKDVTTDEQINKIIKAMASTDDYGFPNYGNWKEPYGLMGKART